MWESCSCRWACFPVTRGWAGENFSLIHFIAPVRLSTPSRISIRPTENSMVRPTRTGIAKPNKIMAAPTATMVSVWPQPQRIPMRPALAIERSRLTIVDTAITWSGSVACRIPRKNPIARIASPLVKQARPFSDFKKSRTPKHIRHGGNFPRKNRRGEGSLFAKDARELTGGMREARAAPRNEIDVARHVQLPDSYFLHPAAFDFPLNAHAGYDRHAHAHLHEALDTFDGGHFNRHVERGAVSRKQLNDAAAKGRFDAVRDKVFFSELGDIDFAFLGQDVLGVHDQGQLILQDFHGLKLGVAGHVRDRAEIQAVVQDFMRDVPRKHAVHAYLDARMLFPELGQGGEKSVDGALVHSQREFAALQALQFGEPFFDFIAEVDQALRIVLQERSRIRKADWPGATDKERLAERVLKLADGQAYGRLGAVKALGGAGEATLFRHHYKDLQSTEIQGSPLLSV